MYIFIIRVYLLIERIRFQVQQQQMRGLPPSSPKSNQSFTTDMTLLFIFNWHTHTHTVQPLYGNISGIIIVIILWFGLSVRKDRKKNARKIRVWGFVYSLFVCKDMEVCALHRFFVRRTGGGATKKLATRAKCASTHAAYTQLSHCSLSENVQPQNHHTSYRGLFRSFVYEYWAVTYWRETIIELLIYNVCNTTIEERSHIESILHLHT